MSLDPRTIELLPEHKERIVDLVEQTGRPWTEIVSEALENYVPHNEPSSNPSPSFYDSMKDVIGIFGKEPASSDNRERELSLAEALDRDGLLGCIQNVPSDLSTNPKYMEGFGRDQDSRTD